MDVARKKFLKSAHKQTNVLGKPDGCGWEEVPESAHKQKNVLGKPDGCGWEEVPEERS